MSAAPPHRSRAASTPAPLALEDQDAVRDLERFLTRAKAMSDTGVRLQGRGSVLAVWVSVLQPRGLGDRVPVALGLRTVRLTAPAAPDVDRVYPIASILDRLARMQGEGLTALAHPPVTESVTWTAVTPPRSGWQPVAVVEDAELQQVAQNGVRELGSALPTDPGASMVAQARAAVWGRMLGGPNDDEGILPAAAAFAAHGLGFLTPGGSATVHAQGPWTRLSSPAGHVLCRTSPRL